MNWTHRRTGHQYGFIRNSVIFSVLRHFDSSKATQACPWKFHNVAHTANALSFYSSKIILDRPNSFGWVQIVLVGSNSFWSGSN
jgi:hypothetical protein